MAKVRASLERIRDPSVQTALSEAAYTHVRPVLKEALVNCPYALTDAEADCLENFGITINPYATQTHTHAACKAIENRMLEIVGKHLPKEKVTMLFLKKSKLRYLRRAAALNDVFINKDMEPKDLFRYDRDTIRNSLQNVDTSLAYMSDTLHFMNFNSVAQLFVDSPKLTTLLATVVLPVEALHRRSSLYPALYSINYHPQGFEYIPGNHGGGAYFHPYDTLDWLKVRKILAKDFYHLDEKFTLTFQMVESIGANHLFIIHKADMITPGMRTFCRDSLVTLPKIFCPDSMNANRPLSKTKAMQLMLYCKSVKQVTERDIYAKFRQIIPTIELELYEPDEIIHLCNYLNFMTQLSSITSYEDLLGNSLWRRLTQPIKAQVKKFLDFFRGQDDFTKLLGVLKWEAFSYSLCPSDFHATFISKSAQDFATSQEVPIDEAVETIRHCRNNPNFVSLDDFEVSSLPDFLSPPAQMEDFSTDESVDDTPTCPTTNLPNQDVPEEHQVVIHNSDWQVDTILPIIRNLPYTQLKGRKCYFLTTSPDIDYGHDSVSYQACPWDEVLSDILLTTGQRANACLIQVYEQDAKIPLHRDDEKVYAGHPILTMNFGQASFSFSNGETFELTDGQWFVMSGKYLTQYKHAAFAKSVGRISLTFRTHVKTLAGHPISSRSLEPTLNDVVEPEEATKNDVSDAPEVPKSFRNPLSSQASEPIPSTTDSLPWNAWKPLLKEHGFEGDQQQLDSSGFMILPITDIKKVPHVPYPSEVPEALQKALIAIKRYPVAITLDHKRAGSYASDIKNSRTGKLLAQKDDKWKAAFAYKMQHEDHVVVGTVIHGCGGSGKSHTLQNWMRTLKADQSDVTVVTPTILLRNDWSTKLPILPAETFKTFEKAIVQPCNPVVIFDDYTKLPPGIIEALVMHHRNVSFIILTGDSRQSVYHEMNPEAYISALPEAVEVFEPYCEFYVNASHRNVKQLANKLGVYSEREGKLKVNFASHHLKASRTPILVPSTMKRNAMADMGHHSMTYAGCQGLTAPKVQILLDNHTQFCSDRVLYTCLSRAVDTIHFINTGPTTGDYWTKLESTPYLKAFIDTYRDEKTELYNSSPADDSPTEPEAPKTHFPVAPKPLLEPLVAELADKESREIFSRSTGYSNTIQTNDPVVQLFQHQQAKDETLYWATIEARLSISTPEENLREFKMKADVGDILFMNYAKLMQLPAEPVPFEERLWEISAAEVRNTYLSKPIGNLVNAATRQSPDFPANKIALFLKSQWVKKVEKLGAIKVKPGQTIASFHARNGDVVRYDARYIRKMRARFQPDNIFINCEATPEDLNKFVKTKWHFNRPAHTNDFTAFDQSQDGAMLQFEVMKAKFFNIPADIIEGYIYIKLNAVIFLGTLGIMRLSGEGPTFDANTECSIAYNATRFHIEDDTAQVYAGDDMALDRISTEKSSFAKLAHQLKLTSKPQFPRQVRGDYAEFCGWVLTPAGILKHSLKMQASIQLQKKINNIAQSARSYALDLRYAYQMGMNYRSTSLKKKQISTSSLSETCICCTRRTCWLTAVLAHPETLSCLSYAVPRQHKNATI
ncbi:ORF 1 [Malva mosaic virus]|uniref:RNA replication protein n=1 Tax=Malva mosaic virus TaxID=392174 RepID=Q0Z8V5_9VIRU|nr:ORF 1 [Malva mosaic virus]ABG48660.1 ORF 1 [Malva mosaic virus]